MFLSGRPLSKSIRLSASVRVDGFHSMCTAGIWPWHYKSLCLSFHHLGLPGISLHIVR